MNIQDYFLARNENSVAIVLEYLEPVKNMFSGEDLQRLCENIVEMCSEYEQYKKSCSYFLMMIDGAPGSKEQFQEDMTKIVQKGIVVDMEDRKIFTIFNHLENVVKYNGTLNRSQHEQLHEEVSIKNNPFMSFKGLMQAFEQGYSALDYSNEQSEPVLKFLMKLNEEFNGYQGATKLKSSIDQKHTACIEILKKVVLLGDSTPVDDPFSHLKQSMHELSLDNFDAKVLRAQKPVLVDFYMSNCPPCKQMSPIIDQLTKLPTIDVYKVNGQVYSELSARYHVKGFPTLMMFKDGQVLDRSVGGKTMTQIQEFIGQSLQIESKDQDERSGKVHGQRSWHQVGLFAAGVVTGVCVTLASQVLALGGSNNRFEL